MIVASNTFCMNRLVCHPLSRAYPSAFSRLAVFHQRTSVYTAHVSQRFMSAGEPLAKRLKMTTNGSHTPVIGTHNGHFHADEALAVFMLRQLPAYKQSSLVRSRDPEVLKECDVVVDVGGVHDDKVKRYDHHQREFAVTFPGSSTKLSSAGLVWMHLGKDIVAAVTGMSSGDPNLELLYQKMYGDFIEAFDANDNGISLYDPAAIRKAGIEKKFSDKGFSMASVVNRYNFMPVKSQESANNDISEEDTRFARASAFVGEQFLGELNDKFESWLPARGVVQKAFADRHQYDAQGRIIVIPWKEESVPWADHLYALEEEAGVKGQVLYALSAETGEANSKWRIRAVSLEPGSFENRKSLPEAWRGVRDEQLSSASGIPGGVFVHAGGFIGGNATFDGVLAMAKKAVE